MRRRAAVKRPHQPDTRYGNVVLGKLVNSLFWDGKKHVAEKILYEAMDIIQASTNQDPCEVVLGAISNVKPSMEVKSRRVGGATYAIPMPVNAFRSQSLAIRWIIHEARKRSEKTMSARLAEEMKSAFERKGAAMKKHEDTHRMAEANRAFAHYRW